MERGVHARSGNTDCAAMKVANGNEWDRKFAEFGQLKVLPRNSAVT